MTATLEGTSAYFADLPQDRIVLIDFWATWCGPCRQIAPVFDTAAANHEDIDFVKVDIDSHGDLAQDYDISAVPTLRASRDGVVVGRVHGAIPGRELDNVIDKIRGLDMDYVRRELGLDTP